VNTEREMKAILGLDKLHKIGWPPSRQRLIHHAVESGFRAFDVAPMYGNGLCEYELGVFLKNQSMKRAEFEINTKFGIPYISYGPVSRWIFFAARGTELIVRKFMRQNESREYNEVALENSVNESLTRLCTDYIDTLFLHEPIEGLEQDFSERLMNRLADMQRKGKIRSYGVSGCRPVVLSMINSLQGSVLQMPIQNNFLFSIGGYRLNDFYVYGVRRLLKNNGKQNLSMVDYESAALAAGATGYLYSTTRLDHLKIFSRLHFH